MRFVGLVLPINSDPLCYIHVHMYMYVTRGYMYIYEYAVF